MMLEEAIPESIPALQEIHIRIDDALDKLRSSQERENVLLYTERNLLVNWCMTALLRLRDELVPPVILDFAGHYHALQRNIGKAGEDFRPSYYVEAILRIGALLLAKDAREKNAARRDVMEWLDPRKIEKHSVMRYDTERFEFLREFAVTRAV
jgi:hypothetical protein